jgi:transcriptional regulator with XRE-family HTH domain
MAKLGRFMKEYRDRYGLSLRDFAVLSGLSHTYIEKLEKGIDLRSGKPVVPTVATLQAIANATGKTLLEILQISGYVPDIFDLKQSADINVNSAAIQEPELKDFWDEMIKREDLKLLLKKVKDLSPEVICRLIKYIKIVENPETLES